MLVLVHLYWFSVKWKIDPFELVSKVVSFLSFFRHGINSKVLSFFLIILLEGGEIIPASDHTPSSTQPAIPGGLRFRRARFRFTGSIDLLRQLQQSQVTCLLDD